MPPLSCFPQLSQSSGILTDWIIDWLKPGLLEFMTRGLDNPVGLKQSEPSPELMEGLIPSKQLL